jgi:dTDP-4-dehydrorhamnose reductase
MKHVLVLGKTGMLGTMVYHKLQNQPELTVAGTQRSIQGDMFFLDVEEDLQSQLSYIFSNFRVDYIINCIGVINIYCRDNDSAGVLKAIRTNSLFPHELAKVLGQLSPSTKTIHISTDCVFSGKEGQYNESALHDPVDFYGKTKSLGEVQVPNWLNIRCSIIGPALGAKSGLMEWFLNQPADAHIDGYLNHFWNGITTLQYANFCSDTIMRDQFDVLRALNHTLHYVVNQTVSKHELLVLLKKVFNRSCCIESVIPGRLIDHTLTSLYLKLPRSPMEDALRELHEYCRKTVFKEQKRSLST